ncbi:lipid IV(A) palmitoyltransferase PagP [Escherichia coli]|uniref:lipid IV(A) palmitoyltransferase PagP n=1 Tax=Escherichia coli TaxID=562 RepID=UPI001560AE77|nr:lipid IV(A) palmitoyltransferase PagP [Escherichia coli]EIM2734791.1 lipid IV(A) palmitoyltransferase PagP [Escherichia coli]MBB7187065.1 lipid IV(A) palmitoyltransferase PagP [Escherichia coli]HCO8322162.1 lipid IV(A) palmitoyltransferase PagP [Escherichia coli]HEF0827126.1 lipid IV(A) palmitoyltransferase PagP [Escherichia coli]HEI2414645.1 lipid IV(A) palmitoyltransferase PagP [Escherichia coli]
MLVLRGFSLFFLLTLLSGNACALFSSAFNEAYHTLSTNVARTWNMPEHYDLYIPSITWHARFAYDQEKIEQYNERPWGAGFGVSSQDEKGNWHGLYLMAFKDSFNKWEPVGGYGWEKKWRPLTDQNVQLGLGYTIGVTARDNWNYIPVPVVLPLASVGYGPVTFQMTYIPGTYNNGNVYFAWARIRF